jgi:hypothetical protein
VSTNYLRRYTDIPALISVLSERKIPLLDPASWDDKNDSRFLALYKDKEKLQSVLALCFTQTDEMYHHWQVFATGSAGVCIRFDRSQLLKAVKKQDGVRTGTVKYLRMAEMRYKNHETRELPFLKRYAYQDEHEFRMLFETSTDELEHLDMAIPLSCITRITLSPWLPSDLSHNLKQVLRAIEGCSKLSIKRSTLIKSEEWHNYGKSATRKAHSARSARK